MAETKTFCLDSTASINFLPIQTFNPAKMAMNKTLFLVLLCITSLALCFADEPVDTSLTVADPFDENRAFQALSNVEEDSVSKAIQFFSSSSSRAYYPLLLALSQGSLFQYTGRQILQGLIIVGSEDDADEQGRLALISPFPKYDTIVSSEGMLVRIESDSLREIEIDRSLRVDIQSYLTKMDLFDTMADKRRTAAEIMGNRGTLQDSSLLQEALQTETDAVVLSSMEVALYKLKLLHPDALERIAATWRLRDLKSPLATPALEARLKQVDQIEPEQDERVIVEIKQALDSLNRFAFFMQVIQTIFVGLSLGSILILISLGLAIIYGQMGVINMAHGEFMMIGAYATYLVQSFFLEHFNSLSVNLSFFLALPISFLCAGFFGLLAEMLIVKHLYRRPLESLLATWGLSLLLIQGCRSIFGDLTAVQQPPLLSGGYEIAPQVVFPFNRIFIMAFTIVVLVSLFALLYRTRFGLKLRAVTQNRAMSSCVGIKTRRVDSAAFFLGTGIAGIAGWAMTLIGNVVPNMGQSYIVDSFLVVVTGGVGKLMGTVFAGLGMGMFNKLLEPLLQAVYAKVLILGLIILFLQIKPTGIFPSRGRNEE